MKYELDIRMIFSMCILEKHGKYQSISNANKE